MRIYLAARYSRREELCGYRVELEVMGHTVTSRWLRGSHHVADMERSSDSATAEKVRFAEEDWEDLMAADCVIAFTERPRSSPSRGGRHVEFGAGLAAGKRMLAVGPVENVFYRLPQVEGYPDWQSVLRLLMLEIPLSQLASADEWVDEDA